MKCPHKVGDTVYLKRIRTSSFDNWIPTCIINKPLKILSITKIPLNNKELWDVELEDVGFCTTSDDICIDKPF